MSHAATASQTRTRKRNLIIAITAALLVATVGYVLVISRAAGPFASVTPESTTLSGNAKLITESDGSKAISFTAPITTPPPTTPPPVTGERSCPAYPAFPNDSCTGVPSGTNLTTLNGDLTTTSNGQVIDGRLITGEVVIAHDNVTIKNSRIKGPIINRNGKKDLKVQDSDIGPDSCPGSSNGGTRLISGDDYTVLRSRLHNNGADVVSLGGTSNGSGEILIQDSIIDRTCYYPDDHLDTIQLYDPGSIAKVTIVHNKIDVRPSNNSGKGNAAIFWADNPGSGSRLTVYNNFMAGGNYTFYGLDASSGSGVIIDLHDNIFAKASYQYGACSFSASSAFNGTAGYKSVNNKLDDGSAAPGC